MKRFCIILLSILLLLAMGGCGNDTVTVVERGPYTVGITDGVESVSLTVNPIQQTITAENGDIYTYTFSGSEVTFTYPDGTEYLWDYTSGIGYGSLIQPKEEYLDYMTLKDALMGEIEETEPGETGNPAYLVFAIFCILIGGVNLVFPYASWYLKYGWHYRDAEPSEAALVINRILGGIIVIIGIVFLFK